MKITTTFHGFSRDFGTMANGLEWSGFRVLLTDTGERGAKSYISKAPDTDEMADALADLDDACVVRVDYDRNGRITRISPQK